MVNFQEIPEEQEALERVLGIELGAALHHFELQLQATRYEWDVYRSLLGTSPERVEMLNKASGYIALAVDESMYDAVISSISRLTDKARFRDDRNLSLRQIGEMTKECDALSPGQIEEIQSLVTAAIEASRGIRRVRNKLIGHNDYSVTVENFEMRRPSRKALEDAIRAIEEVCNYIRAAVELPNCCYLPIRPDEGDNKFFFILSKGVECCDACSPREYHEQFDKRLDRYFNSSLVSD